MSEKVIAIYCFLADFFQETGIHRSHRYQVSNAVVLRAALMAAGYFYGNQAGARLYLRTHYGLDLLDKSTFNGRLYRLETVLEALFYYLADFFKSLNISTAYVIDSFPLAVCDNIRIRPSRLVEAEHYPGKLASKPGYFYGFRVQLITTIEGLPVQYLIHPGAFVDVTALQTMQINRPENSQLYADSGYCDYEPEEYYAECERVYLQVQRRKNSKPPDKPWMNYLKKAIRQRIEQAFSQITRLFPKHIQAVTEKGGLLKITLFLLAYSLEKTL
jgi:hypothetical protein